MTALPGEVLRLLVVALGLVGAVGLLLPHLLRAGGTPHRRDRATGRQPDARPRVAASPARDGSPWRVVAVSGSLAAAVVHAEVTPHHLEEGLLVGGFFLVVAALQATWGYVASRRVVPATLVAGIGGSLGLLAIWTVSRTVGLPWGLTAGREPAGAWDLAAVTWQLAVALACVRGLRHPGPAWGLPLGHLAPWTRAWIALTVVALVLLALTVAPS